MRCDLEYILPHIVSDPILHARWLNTFSYLEFIGFRKIIKSQTSDLMTFQMLEHAVEEGRHALLLKKLAIKFGGIAFESYSSKRMLCSEKAARYFCDLDQACHHLVLQTPADFRQAHFVYLCLTWLVEVRALSVYRLHQKIANSFDIKLPLSGLLAEEDRHLESVENALQSIVPEFENRLKELRVLENKLYSEYLAAVLNEIDLNFDSEALHE